ncbi:hypothetical protein BJX63DRAFT_385808 [Aspergillus granulosus]|uniref:Uncharacterized protein n=1 Tax=Aspergillus granulosus TaxID=176169 RepID=A0ABR4HRN5_9EURO
MRSSTAAGRVAGLASLCNLPCPGLPGARARAALRDGPKKPVTQQPCGTSLAPMHSYYLTLGAGSHDESRRCSAPDLETDDRTQHDSAWGGCAGSADEHPAGKTIQIQGWSLAQRALTSREYEDWLAPAVVVGQGWIPDRHGIASPDERCRAQVARPRPPSTKLVVNQVHPSTAGVCRGALAVALPRQAKPTSRSRPTHDRNRPLRTQCRQRTLPAHLTGPEAQDRLTPQSPTLSLATLAGMESLLGQSEPGC